MQQELTRYSDASNPLLMFALLLSGWHKEQKILHADNLLGKQNRAAAEVMAEVSVHISEKAKRQKSSPVFRQ